MKTKKLIESVEAKRLLMGLSYRNLAQVVGVSYSTLARLARGEGEPLPGVAQRLKAWVEKGESSAPMTRRPRIDPWHVRIEARLAKLERLVASLNLEETRYD